eukprot:2965679-Amphidinium_carterae.1
MTSSLLYPEDNQQKMPWKSIQSLLMGVSRAIITYAELCDCKVQAEDDKALNAQELKRSACYEE